MQGAASPRIAAGRANDGTTFHRPTSMRELFSILEAAQDIRIVAGNTGSGVYKNWPVEPVLVELKHIPQLRRQLVTQVCSDILLHLD